MQNVNYFKTIFSKISSMALTISSIVLTAIAFFFSDLPAKWNCCVSGKIFILISCFLVLFLLLFLITTIFTHLKKMNVIWKKANRSVLIEYGDIFALKPNKNHKQFIVIPVDTQFMTQVDEDSTKVKNPCVSPETLHGKFIRKFYPNDRDVQSLESKINDYIYLKGYQIDTVQMQKYPNSQKNRYEVGTVVEILSEQDSNISYLLLALSEFDGQNHAVPKKENLVNSIISLLEFYDNNCQGGELYIPLMGTGFSRQDISEEEALRLIRATVEQNLEYVRGNVHIVVYEKCRNSVSIF